MDVRKPTAWQGRREFLKEVGTIVVGVLIALAGEQVVEALRWSFAVKEARSSIHQEMAAAGGVYTARLRMAACVERHIADTARLIEEASAKGRLGAVSGVAMATGQQLETSAWQSERAAQTLVHFPRKELARLNTYYAALDGIMDWRTAEADAWNGLAILDGPPKRITDADVAQLRVRLQKARYLAYLVQLNDGRQIERMKALGVTPAEPSKMFLSRACHDIRSGGP